MPTVTVEKPVSLQETANVLQDSLGNGYNVSTPGRGEVRIKHSAVSKATVRLSREDNSTTFHVQGGGLVSRMVNERGIAKKVAETIKGALGTSSEGGPNP